VNATSDRTPNPWVWLVWGLAAVAFLTGLAMILPLVLFSGAFALAVKLAAITCVLVTRFFARGH
jgi:hypothetical protein